MLNSATILRLVVAMLVITGVTLVSQYSRRLAGIIAVMPINVPLVLWIVYSANSSRPEAVAPVAHGMVWGLIPTLFFVLVCAFALDRGWVLPKALLAGYAVWMIALLAQRWLWPQAS